MLVEEVLVVDVIFVDNVYYGEMNDPRNKMIFVVVLLRKGLRILKKFNGFEKSINSKIQFFGLTNFRNEGLERSRNDSCKSFST